MMKGGNATRKKLFKDAQTSFNLGHAYKRTGDPLKAREAFQRALKARVMLHGANDPSVAAVHEELGNLEKDNRWVDKAQQHYDAALRILEGNISKRKQEEEKDGIPAPKAEGDEDENDSESEDEFDEALMLQKFGTDKFGTAKVGQDEGDSKHETEKVEVDDVAEMMRRVNLRRTSLFQAQSERRPGGRSLSKVSGVRSDMALDCEAKRRPTKSLIGPH